MRYGAEHLVGGKRCGGESIRAWCKRWQAARKDEAKRQAKDKAAAAEKLKVAETAAARAREALAAAQVAAKSREAAVATAQEALAAEKTASAAKDDEVRPWIVSFSGDRCRGDIKKAVPQISSARVRGARVETCPASRCIELAEQCDAMLV